MNNLIFCLGLFCFGGSGVLCRYGLSKLMVNAIYPWGTLGINVAGSFLIGVLFAYFSKHVDIDESWKLWLLTGLLGGFTTLSSFSLESLILLQQGRVVAAISYVSSSVALSLLACWFGWLVVIK